MPFPDFSQNGLKESITNGLIGFFGVVAAFLFLPKLLKYATRRLLFGFIGEIAAVIIAGLIAEKTIGQAPQEK